MVGDAALALHQAPAVRQVLLAHPAPQVHLAPVRLHPVAS